MAKLVDALCSGRSARKGVLVRIQFWALGKACKFSLQAFLFSTGVKFPRYSRFFPLFMTLTMTLTFESIS